MCHTVILFAKFKRVEEVKCFLVWLKIICRYFNLFQEDL